MFSTNPLVLRVLKSLRERTFFIKLHNRISRTKYVPSQEALLDEFLAQHYPGDGWRTLSPIGKRTWVDFSPFFSDVAIKTIAYVGAHDGSVALSLDEAFPGRTFHLIEPLPQVFASLVQNVRHRSNMHCHNVAAGAAGGWQHMFVDEFTQASSFLPYAPLALKEYPFLGNQQKVQVHVLPLDEILKGTTDGVTDFLIIDVQGFEDQVIQGASDTLRNCKAVMGELSLEPLYFGSSSFDSVYRALVNMNFSLRYLLNPSEGSSRRILQIDGIFCRGVHHCSKR